MVLKIRLWIQLLREEIVKRVLIMIWERRILSLGMEEEKEMM